MEMFRLMFVLYIYVVTTFNNLCACAGPGEYVLYLQYLNLAKPVRENNDRFNLVRGDFTCKK